jgi:ATP/maltotriose-dependent transcriptional regulator MalT
MVYLFSGELNKALAEFKAVNSLEENRKEHDFYQAQVYVLLYLQKNNRNHRKEAEQILANLVKGSEPFPHSERLKNFVSTL